MIIVTIIFNDVIIVIITKIRAHMIDASRDKLTISREFGIIIIIILILIYNNYYYNTKFL